MNMFAGGAALILLGTLAGEWGQVDPARISARSVAALLYLIVFGAIIGFTAYLWLLKNVTLAAASTYAYVNPLVAVLLGWALASEPLEHVQQRAGAAHARARVGVVPGAAPDRDRAGEQRRLPAAAATGPA